MPGPGVRLARYRDGIERYLFYYIIIITNLINLLQVFSALLWATSPGGDSLPGIPRMEELRRIFPKDLEITWTVEADTFPRLKLSMNFS